MLIQSISGVRGVVPVDLNASMARKYALAFHRFCGEGSLIIGRDTRHSGSEIVTSVIETLISAGRNVQDCGIVPTPTVQFAVSDTDAIGAIIVTASHNPPEYNGLKFVAQDGCFLNKSQFDRLMEEVTVTDDSVTHLSGSYSLFDQVLKRHIDRILTIEFLNLDSIRSKRFKVAVDTVNGSASEALPLLFSRLNCEVVRIHCEPTGNFRRGTEPLPEHLGDLMNLVKKEECHLGFATDPDGDRLAIIDEQGNPVGEEYTLALATAHFLRKVNFSQTVVTNLSTTLAIDKIAQAYSSRVERTPVGEIHVVEKMKEIGARLGGEGNGGVILSDVHLGRDCLVGAVLILNLLAQENQTLSQVVSGLPKFYMVKDKIRILKASPERDQTTLISFDELMKLFPDASIDKRDGVKFLWDDRWVHIRKSNTEPIFRIYAEAPTLKEAWELVNRIKNR